jgi:hypothetical protein
MRKTTQHVVSPRFAVRYTEPAKNSGLNKNLMEIELSPTCPKRTKAFVNGAYFKISFVLKLASEKTAKGTVFLTKSKGRSFKKNFNERKPIILTKENFRRGIK